MKQAYWTLVSCTPFQILRNFTWYLNLSWLFKKIKYHIRLQILWYILNFVVVITCKYSFFNIWKSFGQWLEGSKTVHGRLFYTRYPFRIRTQQSPFTGYVIRWTMLIITGLFDFKHCIYYTIVKRKVSL
jgi:hypothetical protein